MLRGFDETRSRSFWHRLAHLTGMYTGDVVSWTMDRQVWIGFQCGTCGNIEGVHAPRAAAKGGR